MVGLKGVWFGPRPLRCHVLRYTLLGIPEVKIWVVKGTLARLYANKTMWVLTTYSGMRRHAYHFLTRPTKEVIPKV